MSFSSPFLLLHRLVCVTSSIAAAKGSSATSRIQDSTFTSLRPLFPLRDSQASIARLLDIAVVLRSCTAILADVRGVGHCACAGGAEVTVLVALSMDIIFDKVLARTQCVLEAWKYSRCRWYVATSIFLLRKWSRLNEFRFCSKDPITCNAIRSSSF
jgi:hypothetical protein